MVVANLRFQNYNTYCRTFAASAYFRVIKNFQKVPFIVDSNHRQLRQVQNFTKSQTSVISVYPQNHHEKYIQIRTNMPSITLVIREKGCDIFLN